MATLGSKWTKGNVAHAEPLNKLKHFYTHVVGQIDFS